MYSIVLIVLISHCIILQTVTIDKIRYRIIFKIILHLIITRLNMLLSSMLPVKNNEIEMLMAILLIINANAKHLYH